MKFSEKWLREWVNPKVDSKELIEQLTMLGLEVDGHEPAAGAFSGVVVGEITAVHKHPDAEKLNVCQVDCGDGTLQIVCGAPNAAVGLKAPLARIGAVLPGDFKIKQAKLRGVESHGMLCSEVELGLSQDGEGLMSLPPACANGTDLRAVLGLDDVLIDVDLTPNRADCFCIAGIAREVATVNNAAVTAPDIQSIEAVTDAKIDVDIQALDGCPQYVSRVITGLRTDAQSPLWLTEKLRRSGLRPIHPVVDVTNYVMLELGQPMHAFDLASLQTPLCVRMAHPGEQMVLLDGSEATLDAEFLMIADASRPLAVAGVIGGKDSGVSDATESVVLESAFFDPATVMGKSRRLGIHTESSMRFERGVDPQGQVRAMQRATALIVDICGGQPGPVQVHGEADRLPQRCPIELQAQHLERVLGFTVENEKISNILNNLGFEVQVKNESWTVQPPSWRFDVSIAEDLIEEVVRVVGYDSMPATALSGHMHCRAMPETLRSEAQLADHLHALGYQQVINYSFVSEKQLQDARLDAHAFALANPLNRDLAVMRTSLLPGLLENVKHNVSRQHTDMSLYENGVVFSHDGEIREHQRLGLLRCGRRVSEQWGLSNEPVDFYDLKGDVESLLAGAHATLQFKPSAHAHLHPGRQADLCMDGVSVGWLGQVHPELLKRLKIKTEVLLAELDVPAIRRQFLPHWQATSKYPAVRRDLSIVLDENVSFDAVRHAIRTAMQQSGQSLVDIVLFDVFRGDHIESGCKSFAIGMIFQEKNRTLEDKDVDKLVAKAVSFLAESFNAEIRGGE